MAQQAWPTAAVWVANGVLLAVLIIGTYTDLRWRRLPNWLTLGGAIAGLLVQVTSRGLDGGKDALLGWALGCALLLIPFLIGGLGAGDVKLLAATGALRGAGFVLVSAIYIALIGGVLAIVVLAKRGLLPSVLRSIAGSVWFTARSLVLFRKMPPLESIALSGGTGVVGQPLGELKPLGLPYGVAIAAGSLLALGLGH